MKKIRLSDLWCNWIRASLNSVRALVLINGTPTKEFAKVFVKEILYLCSFLFWPRRVFTWLFKRLVGQGLLMSCFLALRDLRSLIFFTHMMLFCFVIGRWKMLEK